MAIFDILNPPAVPDSDLDPDLGNDAKFTIQNSTKRMIAPGDWVDVDPGAISADPSWGFSFQVCNIYPSEYIGAQAVGILVSGDGGQTYAETQLSCSWVTNTFRRIPEVE
jgi:photosystem II stability/assembly factor-like uncharacterized protein